MVSLLFVVFAISKNGPKQSIGEWVASIKATRAVYTKIVGARCIKGGVDTHVACHSLKVEAELQVVIPLEPREGVGHIHDLVSAIKRPAAVNAKTGKIRDSLTGGLRTKSRGEPETDVRQQIQSVRPEDTRQGKRLAVRPFERQQTLLVSSVSTQFEGDIHLMGSINPPGEFVDQIRSEAVDHSSHCAG